MLFAILLSCSLWILAQSNCDSEIYCRGPILEAIQQSGIFKDSKKYVDMSSSKSKAAVLKSFAQLQGNFSSEKLNEFVRENFHRPGYEMKIVIPKDWQPSPAFLSKIKDKKLRNFGALIHSKWKALTRRFDRRKLCNECQASSLELPYPFIVPGGRFREFYYWDSFWILEGLFVSEMCTTASGLIENMMAMIDELGFIPNGARIYYLNRSQPPMFAMMVDRYLTECMHNEQEKGEFRTRALPLLEKEYKFWMKERTAEIQWQGHNHTLNVYRAEHWMPRPESYTEDTAAAAHHQFDSDVKKQLLFQNIASAAESGWDFSRRWLNNSDDFSSIRTVLLVPTDLNSVMHRYEMIISEIAAKNNQLEKSQEYKNKANSRLKSINDLLLVNDTWIDFDLQAMGPARTEPFISDIAPLWFIHEIDSSVASKALGQVDGLLFNHSGGVVANSHSSGQQWDFPNTWAPIQHLTIELYLRLDNGTRQEFYYKALNIAQRWINSTFCGVELFSQIFEKYNADLVGHPGGGGEYIVQEGFGWTNGVILWILNKFGDDLVVPTLCVQANPPSKKGRFAALIANIFLTIGLLLNQ